MPLLIKSLQQTSYGDLSRIEKKSDSSIEFSPEVAVIEDEPSEHESQKKNSKLSYSRVITTGISSYGLDISKDENGNEIFNYSNKTQSFQICIDVNEDERQYQIITHDENGDEKQYQFDPYKVDPTNSNYPEFIALCKYIQETDASADSIMRDFSEVEDIFEKKNYYLALNNYESVLESKGCVKLAESLNNIVTALQKFMDNIASYQIPEEDRMPERYLLPEYLSNITDGNGPMASEDFWQQYVRRLYGENYTATELHRLEVVNSNNITVRDVLTLLGSISCKTSNGTIEHEYETFVSKDGIRIHQKKDYDTRTKEYIGEENDICFIPFESDEQYEKVMNLLSNFEDSSKIVFMSQKGFWENFLADKIDMEEFTQCYELYKNGDLSLFPKNVTMIDSLRLNHIYLDVANYFRDVNAFAAYGREEIDQIDRDYNLAINAYYNNDDMVEVFEKEYEDADKREYRILGDAVYYNLSDYIAKVIEKKKKELMLNTT
ncbi:hypothetical protein [Butyrivibrio sp. NC3005]|uniref:hypothetical protein n=1 Tax=Butyrivibrio sp. NC3005 TaxID=1280685 RepID=UPI0004071B4C|nr:hypothetical protein [Butyrivibrio sp. NC3005]